MKWVTI